MAAKKKKDEWTGKGTMESPYAWGDYTIQKELKWWVVYCGGHQISMKLDLSKAKQDAMDNAASKQPVPKKNLQTRLAEEVLPESHWKAMEILHKLVNKKKRGAK